MSRERQEATTRPTAATLGVVITNYNTWELTERCVNQTLLHAPGLDSILVADDASPRPPSQPLDSRVRVTTNPSNLGLVKTLNRALAAIDTELVVIFDSDAYPTGDFVGCVRRAFEERPDLAVAGFSTVDEAGKPTGSFEPEPGVASLILGQRLHAWWLRLVGDYGPGQICVYTCAMAVRRRAVLDLGGFDEAFDWLDLDHELCMKVNRSAWKVGRLPGAIAFHRGAGTFQAASQRVLRFYKNRWLLLSKFGKIRHPKLTRAVVLARLSAEFALLSVGAVLKRDDVWTDKIEGRRLAIRHAVTHYR